MLPLHHYRWPAEWETHAATWTAWPVNPNTWPGIFDRIPPKFAEFAAAIAEFEPLRILAGGHGVRASAQPLLDAACARRGSRFTPEWFDIPVNDSWCRDHGPIFLTGRPNSPATGSRVILDWDYNAWGGKYPPWDLDRLTAQRIAAAINVRSIRPRLILEGGAIEGNGDGTVLTTDSCLLNPNRNPNMTRNVMTEILQVWLQAEHVVWLPGHGIIGDDTDGHIDQTARFTTPRNVLVAAPWDDDAPEAPLLRANFDAVAAAHNSRGQSLTPIPLPLPTPRFLDDNRLPASYCNYILVNGGLIVPTFQDPADDIALQILQDAHPDRKIIGIDAFDLAWGLGSFHCMTQQEPAALS